MVSFGCWLDRQDADKSTVLRAIAGLDSITEGNLYIGDRQVNESPARQRDVAMVF